MTSEDTTLNNDELTPEERWSYYVTAYSMRDPTEGVQFSKMRMPLLKRNLPPKLEEDEKAALREKRHDRFIEKFVNNPSWARGLSKDQVDESNQRFRSWVDGTLSDSPAPGREGSASGSGSAAPANAEAEKDDGGDVEMTDAEPTEA